MADDRLAPEELAAGRTQPSIWTFLAADCFGFGMFFVVFMAQRFDEPLLFDASSRKLEADIGLANTLLLLSSSWLVALAINAARRGAVRRAGHTMLVAAIFGSGFAMLKIVEYSREILRGVTPATNDFFSFYFMLTGVHFLHYLIGIGVLVATVVALRQAAREGIAPPAWIESGALYWHMVDLLWLFLFPMLYLLAAR